MILSPRYRGGFSFDYSHAHLLRSQQESGPIFCDQFNYLLFITTNICTNILFDILICVTLIPYKDMCYIL